MEQGTPMSEAKFIAFEGIDGSGTTTQAKFAARWLETKGVRTLETREPTNGAVGQVIREALSRRMPGRKGIELEPERFALLFAADRLDHTRARILPALDQGGWVVSDRCYLSSFAYQSVGCDLDWVRSLNRHCRRADLIILLDLDAEAAYRRVTARTLFESMEVFETVEKMAVIRDNYLDLARLLGSEGERIVTIDAAPPIDVVADKVREVLSGLL